MQKSGSRATVTSSPAAATVLEPRDVFISYSSLDREWVEYELLRQLIERGVTVVIDFRDFTPGRPVMDNIAESVRRCRYTLAVITPAYLESLWVQYERCLVGLADPAASEEKLVPLLLDHCEVPDSIAWITCADFRDPARHPDAFKQLVARLRGRPDNLAEVATIPVVASIVALSKLMHTPAVRAVVGDYRETLTEIGNQIDLISQYKELHDFFQKAEFTYGFLYEAKKRLRSNESSWHELHETVLQLEAVVRPLLAYAQEVSLRPGEVLWTPRLERALDDSLLAVPQKDLGRLSRALERLHGVLGVVPSKLNHSMVTTAKKIPLKRLLSKFELIRESLEGERFESEVEARIAEFRCGIMPLRKLNARLCYLVAIHDCLQEIVDMLCLYGDFPVRIPTAANIRDMWQDLSDLTKELARESASGWIEELRSVSQRLDREIEGLSPADEGDLESQIGELFRTYRSKAKLGFNQVNTDLKLLCGKLQTLGRHLGSELGGLCHE